MTQKLTLLLFTAIFSCYNWAAQPDKPTGFRIVAYSSSTAELFWDRPDIPLWLYEVSRDGILLGETDGVSLMDRSFSGDATQVYELIAINQKGERSAPVMLRFGDPENPGTNPPDDNGPATPEGLRIAVYSQTTAELFWNRPSTPGLFYDVFKDSILLEQTDGVSFVDRSHGDGQSLFEIIAIDADGARSNPASIYSDGSFIPPLENPDTDTPAPTDGPLPPAGARIDVYSSTAAELFWTRPDPDEQVVSTEVLRDGQLLGNTAGTSFYDFSRTPGEDHVYSLTAIDADGKRSEITSVRFDFNKLFTSNLKAVLQEMDSIANSKVISLTNDIVINLFSAPDTKPDDRTVGETGRVTNEEGFFVIRTPVNCHRGGSYLLDQYLNSPITEILVDHCDLGTDSGEIYNGKVLVTLYQNVSGVSIFYDEFSILLAGTSRTIHKGQSSRLTLADTTWSSEATNDISYSTNLMGIDDPVRVNNLSMEIIDLPVESPRTSIQLSFEFSSPATDNRSLRVSTLEIFRDRDSGTGYSSGRLLVDDNAGTSMQIDASFGTRDEFWLSTFFNGGSGGGQLAKWGDDFELPCITTDDQQQDPLEHCDFPRTTMP